MITLYQLINVAPFPEETKEELFSASNSLSDAKKFELEELCWTLINQWFQNELRGRQEQAVLEMAKGGKVYEKEDIVKMGDDLFMEIIRKFEAEKNEEDIDKVRAKLSRLN